MFLALANPTCALNPIRTFKLCKNTFFSYTIPLFIIFFLRQFCSNCYTSRAMALRPPQASPTPACGHPFPKEGELARAVTVCRGRKVAVTSEQSDDNVACRTGRPPRKTQAAPKSPLLIAGLPRDPQHLRRLPRKNDAPAQTVPPRSKAHAGGMARAAKRN